MSANPLVDFLRTFGPVEASDSLCDENLRQTQAQFSVKPLKAQAPRAEAIRESLLGAEPQNVILTGTAGDGKTYHIRQFFTDQFKDRTDAWPGEDGVLLADLPTGQELRIIRDLSEVSDSEKANELEGFCQALLGQRKDRIYLVAANDGQLLKYFRDAAEAAAPAEKTRYEELHQILAEMLREERETVSSLNLRLLNLSRTWDNALVENIFDAILEHEDWSSGCGSCSALAEDKPCPIQLNRSLLRRVDGAASPFRDRLRQSLRLAAANDQHVPIRQLLTLVVNIVLGDAKNPDDPLLSCATAKKRANQREYRHTNPYNNACGLNLRPERRNANRVFRVFEVLAVGLETNNLIDAALIQGKPEALHNAIFSNEQTYGSNLYAPLLQEYLSKGGTVSGSEVINTFRRGLEAQRRRAFFRLEDTETPEMSSPWRLTIFHHGGVYLKLLDSLGAGARKDVVDAYTRQLIRGLNRAFTGMMASDDEKLWLAGSIGKTDDPAGKVATIDPIDRASMTSFSVRLSLDPTTKRPSLSVATSKLLGPMNLPTLDLRPLLFEYLMRVSNGSLPSSFSRQCHQEIRHFALVTQTQVKAVFEDEEYPGQVVRVLSLGDKGEMRASPIEI